MWRVRRSSPKPRLYNWSTDGQQLLYRAIDWGHYNLHGILKLGIGVNSPDLQGRTPSYHSAIKFSLDGNFDALLKIAVPLLVHGADPDATYHGKTIGEIAAACPGDEAVRALGQQYHSIKEGGLEEAVGTVTTAL